MKQEETPGLPSDTMIVEFLHETIDYLSDTAEVFAAATSCPDDDSLAILLSNLVARPAVVSVLLLFAQGTDFATLLRVLNTLSAT